MAAMAGHRLSFLLLSNLLLLLVRANNEFQQQIDGHQSPPSNQQQEFASPNFILTENFNTQQRSHVTNQQSSQRDTVEPQSNSPKVKLTLPANKCEIWLSSSESGNLTSVGFPGGQHLNCIYRLSPSDITVCSLELLFLDVENEFKIKTKQKKSPNSSTIEKEFALESCTGPSVEFNNRKRYCQEEWKGRTDVVRIDPNYERDFVFRFVEKEESDSNGFTVMYRAMPNSCNTQSKMLDKMKDSDSTLHPVQVQSPQSASADCEERHTELEFEIKSDRYPRNYSHNLDCVHYVVRASHDVCGLELRFVTFDIEDSEGCAYDFLEVDGETFCGRLPNDSRNIFKFDTPVKSISFQSDSQVNAPGFHIRVRQVKDCANAFMPEEIGSGIAAIRPQKCNIVLHNSHGQLASLQYPEPYPDDLLCAYTIERHPQGNCGAIEIDFDHFDLQESKDCTADFLELDGQRYCGQSLDQLSKIVRFNEEGNVRLLFKSDSTQTSNGFLLNFTQTECEEKGQNKIDDESTTISTLEAHETKSFKAKNQSFFQEPCYTTIETKKFTLESERVNGKYKENQECRYVVKKYSNKVCYLEMHFQKFDLEASPDCQYDYMEIGNAVRLCGTLNQETSRIYVFDRPEMVVTFHSDTSNERQGFIIQSEQLECEGDRIVRPQIEETATSTTVTRTPTPNVSKSTSREETKEDSLQSLEQSKFEQKHQNDSQVILQQQENFIHQTSEFDFVPPKAKLTLPNRHCSKTYHEKEFFIYSPGFPQHYQTDLDCLYMIHPYNPNVCKLEVNFDSFELQPYDFEKNCLRSDFLDVDNREQFCGRMNEAQSKIYPVSANQTFFIHFHSDSFRTSLDKGFRLYVRQIECHHTFPPTKSLSTPQTISHCNQLLTSPSFDLRSPLFPSLYPANSYCEYRIIKLHNVNICHIEVNFLDFDLQSSRHCTKDYVSFNGVKVCGPIIKDTVRMFPFYENEFTVSFFSDQLISGRGFHLRIRQNECPPQPLDDPSALKRPPPSSGSFTSSFQIYHANQQCQQSYSALLFEMESPNYPAYYLPSLSCIYSVHRRHRGICKLELYFIDFDIEPSSRCVTDFLLIDGIKYCNSNRPTSVLSLPFHEPEKRIYFKSTSFRHRKGYLIQARQVDCEAQPVKPLVIHDTKSPHDSSSNGLFSPSKFIFLPSLPSICEICVTEVTGNIQSYDYPNFYPPNVNCTYRITPLPDNCMVQVRFSEFDFDYSPECNQDYLEINRVRYCGNQLKGVSMVLLNKRKDDLAIRMVSSSRGAIVKPSFRGFRASYTQLPCLDSRPVDSKSPRPTKPTSNTKGEPSRFTLPSPLSTTTTPVPIFAPDDRIYCDQTFDEKMFDIKSPGFPYRYFDNLNCAYLIRKNSANVCRLKVTFNFFNVVGEDGNCQGDYLDLFNTRICGVLERYTKKEVPFLQEKLFLNFHTNNHRTANGFHIVVEQVDCIAVEPLTRASPSTDPSKTSGGKLPGLKSPTLIFQQRGDLKYDDDEIMSDYDTRTKTTAMMATTPKSREVGTDSHVIYEPKVSSSSGRKGGSDHTYEPQMRSTTATPQTKEDSDGIYPLRYYSRNITVKENDSQVSKEPSFLPPTKSAVTRPNRIEQLPDFDRDNRFPGPPVKMRPKAGSVLCEEGITLKMYFELKSSDLRLTPTAATCQLRVKKAKSSICQLDIMFIQYQLNDTTCGQQYLSVDGERICGHMQPSTIKKFWFVQPEMYLFVKLAQSDTFDDSKFEIKARQVECASNVEQKHRMSPTSQVQVTSGQMAMVDSHDDDSKSFQKLEQDYVLRGPKGQRYNNNRISQRPLKNEQSLADDQQQPEKIQDNRDKNLEPDRYEVKGRQPSRESDSYNRYCDLIDSDMQFRIVSPRDRGMQKCRYTIRKANDKVCAIDVRFNMFRLQDDVHCAQEYLEIDSGKICGAFPIGHERRYYFLPKELEKTIYYISSKTSRVPGDFILEVQQIEDCSKPMAPKPVMPMPTVCDMSSGNLRGHLKSPNYPAPYGDFTRCTFRIQAFSSDYCSVKLVVRDIDIELDSQQSSKCDKDALEFPGAKLCGKKLTISDYTVPFAIINGVNEVQLKFTSDATGNGRGFDIEYTQEPCAKGEKSRPTGLVSPGQKGMSRDSRFRPPTKSLENPASRSSPARPHYPANYVSKAHLLKTMDRQEFIKMMMMQEERENMRMPVNQKDLSGRTGPAPPLAPKAKMLEIASKMDTTTSTTTTTTQAPSTLLYSTSMSIEVETTTLPIPTTTDSLISE